MPLFSLKNANRVVPLQDKIFSYTRPFCSDRVVFERILRLLVGESNIKAKDSVGRSISQPEDVTRDFKMENRSSICHPALSPPPEIVRKHTTSQWYPPVHPYLGFCSRRELTFQKWTPDSKQTPQVLNEAGFFYARKSLS